MKKCIGNIALKNCTLKYYVFGNRSTGYGIEIKVTRVEKAVQIVSYDFGKVMDVAKKLRCGSVFPTNLSEIIEDENFDDFQSPN
ncbi:hypothetical protein FL966_12225 [Caproiciproducens galactitolivorans]|uniref:Uncharacterized protein n=1 Tax=Caproiciproducens galactitolivorans TaxID=642589 RepID=A0A4Z0YLD0_9FIRM|nr:DUF6514 family protein [Caproiciproducens galactitolivorans]QEY35768.1 hypothetical protein FL966_12225 [Caproiciproducens galactitolivorans]TGJ77502.1 hypothetical protein CAGA_08740 [Caproiciproducens galactitolivorans]